jgi:tRNA G26 N,N-dimethylase Trm1
MQLELIPNDKPKIKKTYRAIRHDVVRTKQSSNNPSVHHPDQKINQINRILPKYCGWGDLSTLELFAGQGNLTKEYAKYGEVIANEYKLSTFNILQENCKLLSFAHCNRVDSFIDFHNLISLKLSFDVIDLDPYGFPNRFFPDIFLLIQNGLLFVTMPKPSVNILNGITQTHLTAYYGEPNPSHETIVKRIATWGLCHWRKVVLIDSIDLKSVWRMVFTVNKVKATEYTGVKNR